MPDTVAVGADDVRLVTRALSVATSAFGSRLVAVPGFGDALEAAGRLEAAADQSAFPQDPVGASKMLAIGLHETFRNFMDAGFDQSEAFRLVEIQASASAQLGLARAIHG